MAGPIEASPTAHIINTLIQKTGSFHASLTGSTITMYKAHCWHINLTCLAVWWLNPIVSKSGGYMCLDRMSQYSVPGESTSHRGPWEWATGGSGWNCFCTDTTSVGFLSEDAWNNGHCLYLDNSSSSWSTPTENLATLWDTKPGQINGLCSKTHNFIPIPPM